MKFPVTHTRRIHPGPVNFPNVRLPLNSLRWLMRRETGRSGRFKRQLVSASLDGWGELNPEHTPGIEVINKSRQVNPNLFVDFVFIVIICFSAGWFVCQKYWSTVILPNSPTSIWFWTYPKSVVSEWSSPTADDDSFSRFPCTQKSIALSHHHRLAFSFQNWIFPCLIRKQTKGIAIKKVALGVVSGC